MLNERLRKWRSSEAALIIRFVVMTLLYLVGFFLLVHLDFVRDRLIIPYTEFVAASSRVALRLLGVDASGSGVLVVAPQFSVEVGAICNGVEVTAILFAAILAFPAGWKQKLIGLAIGYPAVYLINLLRIIVLFFIGFKQPSIFETVHYYYAQAFVILAAVALWLLWVSYSNHGKHGQADAA